MEGRLTAPIVGPEVALHWMGGLLVAFLLFAVIVRIIDTFRTDNQQRTVTGIAVTTGVLISIGVSPFGEFATELARLFEVIPSVYPEWIKALLAMETILGLLYGFGVMWKSGGLYAIASFVLALFGGLLLPYTPFIGIFLIIIAWILMEISPAERW